MVKVDIHDASVQPAETASAQAVAVQRFEITDERGRVIVLRKPPVLAQYRLVESLGAVAANQTYVGMVVPLLFIASIDGQPVPSPNSKAEVEALIQRLDEPGLEAVMAGMEQHFAKQNVDAEGKSNA